MKSKTSLTLILFFLFIVNSYSQHEFKPCYVVDNKSDTIFGTGNMSKNQENCLFMSHNARHYTKVDPKDIVAFRIIDGKYYISGQVVESNGSLKWYFLEYLVDGEIDLLVINKSFRYFIQKGNGNILELKDNVKNIRKINGSNYSIKDNRFIGQMKLFMADAPDLFPEIEKIDKLRQRDLVDLSMKYHMEVCNEYECVNYTKKIPKITYKLEILSGVNYHNSYYTPQYGVLVHIWSPLRNERLYIKTGILYSTKLHMRKEYLDEWRSSFTFKIPVSFQYVFGNKAFKPIIAFGFPTGNYLLSSIDGGFIYSLSQKVELTVSASVDAPVYLLAGGSKSIFDNNFGHTINTGLIYKFKNHSKM